MPSSEPGATEPACRAAEAAAADSCTRHRNLVSPTNSSSPLVSAILPSALPPASIFTPAQAWTSYYHKLHCSPAFFLTPDCNICAERGCERASGRRAAEARAAAAAPPAGTLPLLHELSPCMRNARLLRASRGAAAPQFCGGAVSGRARPALARAGGGRERRRQLDLSAQLRGTAPGGSGIERRSGWRPPCCAASPYQESHVASTSLAIASRRYLFPWRALALPIRSSTWPAVPPCAFALDPLTSCSHGSPCSPGSGRRCGPAQCLCHPQGRELCNGAPAQSAAMRTGPRPPLGHAPRGDAVNPKPICAPPTPARPQPRSSPP